MKKSKRRPLLSALAAGILALSAAPAWGKSAKQVFAEAAPSVVVVYALDSGGETKAQGSGVVVGQNEVATNCHVIDEAKTVAVRQAADSGGGETYRMDADILARDDERDLCLLFVAELSEPPAAPAAAMGAAKALAVGEEVFAIGAPKGWELSLSRGVVSQLRGIHGKRVAPLVQTDAAISSGSSGGGLFNEDGELVGITTFKWKGESLNFAIPVEWVGDLRKQGQAELKAAEKLRECLANPNYKCLIAAALSAAQSISGIMDRVEILRVIVTAQVQAGYISEATVVAKSVNDGYLRAWVMRSIAAAQAKTGNIDAAHATANSITYSSVRDGALDDIAEAQTMAGDVSESLAEKNPEEIQEAIEQAIIIENAASRAKELATIAQYLAAGEKN